METDCTPARLKDVQKKVTLSKYKKIAVVRNPWARMVSMYCFLAQFKRMYETRDGVNRKGIGELELLGFSEWLLKYGKTSHGLATSDIAQCNWLTIDGKFAADRIIRYEHLVKDFEKHTGISKIHLPITHHTAHRDYHEYYTGDARDFIYEHFKKDIKRFKYEY